jgi:hypothetical protein
LDFPIPSALIDQTITNLINRQFLKILFEQPALLFPVVLDSVGIKDACRFLRRPYLHAAEVGKVLMAKGHFM